MDYHCHLYTSAHIRKIFIGMIDLRRLLSVGRRPQEELP
jgi:hypothetical protein